MTIKVKSKNHVFVPIKELMNDKDFNIRMEPPLYSKNCVMRKERDAIIKELREYREKTT